ncbi:Uncharacterised protein [Candidatus Gugararchaeum adminiculabundum]|nr:Uncharacterised protein [Candidatus Gugararchaeum adminiculabundum]
MHFYEQTFLFFAFAGVFMLFIFGFNGGRPGQVGDEIQTQNSLVYAAGNFLVSPQASMLFFILSVFIVTIYGTYWLTHN